MRNLDIVQLIQREIKAALKLVPWLVVSFLLITLLWRSDLAAFAGLNQSPAGLFQSPATETPVPPSPTFTPTEAPTVEPEAPRITATPTATEPLPEPTETPIEVTDTPTPTVTTTATPTATPTMSPTPAPTVLSATATPTASPTADGSDRYSEGNSNLKFEWGMLFDSVALGMTYLWLCCGVFVLLGIPLAFVILWVASKRYRQPEAAEQGEPESQEQSEE